jgi:lysophospholipase L1-like esterase
MLRRPAIVNDVAVSGMPVFKSLERYQQFVAPLYRPDAPVNLIAFHGGDNDIAAHHTPEQTYAAFTRYVQLAHAQGFKVIVSTELQRTTWKPEWQMFLSQYNQYLLGNRARADAVIDLAGAPGLRDPAQRTNPQFFFHDQIHLSDNGYHILARMILGAMNRLIPPAG